MRTVVLGIYLAQRSEQDRESFWMEDLGMVRERSSVEMYTGRVWNLYLKLLEIDELKLGSQE